MDGITIKFRTDPSSPLRREVSGKSNFIRRLFLQDPFDRRTPTVPKRPESLLYLISVKEKSTHLNGSFNVCSFNVYSRTLTSSPGTDGQEKLSVTPPTIVTLESRVLDPKVEK